ncbi:MAG: alpha/beta fold hydrolase [Hyphomicrobiaceae bacterium]|nr:alpha/beta fold hydrolase [Hyphomicrobiaceae bacterium]
MAIAGTEGVHEIRHFRFESGETLDHLKVGYVTYGRLNADRSNAVLLTPGTSNGRHWADALVGPGAMYDTDQYFFIGTDGIGGGTSSQPADGLGTRFPRYGIRDMVRAEHAMVTEGLGLERLLAVAGPSMGSFQGVEWGINYPDFMQGLILIVPAARSDALFGSIVAAMTAMITSHPGYQGGTYRDNPTDAIVNGGLVYFPWVYSDAYLRKLVTEAERTAAMLSLGNNWARMWDANSLLWRYAASRGHDASRPFNDDMAAALARVKARCLLLVSDTDRTIPAYLSRELYDGLTNAEWVTIPTILGHLGGSRPSPGTTEHDLMHGHIRRFLGRLRASPTQG